MSNRFKFRLSYCAVLVGTAMSTSAFAADKELLDILLTNQKITQEQYNYLMAKEQENAKKVEDLKALEARLDAKQKKLEQLEKKLDVSESHSNSGSGEVKVGEKGLEFESKDGNFKAAIGGRLQVDSQVNFNQDEVLAATGAARTNELSDGVNIRRARVHLEGTMFKDYGYKFEYDFSRGNGTVAAGITDAYLTWNALKPFSLTIGQFKEPFSLEEATSNRYITFIERNMAVNTFSDNPNAYKVGLAGSYFTNRWSATGAIQTEPVGGGWAYNTSVNTYPTSASNVNGSNSRSNGSGDTSWDVTGRITARPWLTDAAHFLHVGAAGSYRSIDNNYNADGSFSNGGMAFFATLNGNVDRTNILNTGSLTNSKGVGHYELEHMTRFGGEAALVYGSFSAQAEYLQTNLSGTGYTDETLQGYYAYASWFLTGESRVYKAKTGAWDRIIPHSNFDMHGGLGAWEVAVGYDYLDLSDGIVNGGQADTVKFGVNWYMNSHFKLMANLIHVLDVNTNGMSNVRSAAFNDTNPDILEFRGQVDF